MSRLSLCLFSAIALGFASLPALRADDDSATMPERTLKELVERQNSLLADAAKQGKNLDEDSLQPQLQQLSHEYELLLHQDPKFAEAYVSYGYLLRKVGMEKEAVGLMLKANDLNPDNPLVKNEIGNYLAEEGKPLEAVGYYLAAIKLAPDEPLYHYQLGTLLHEGRDEFIRSGNWTVDSIDLGIHDAFKRAAELAPNRIEFTYRYAESFYEMRHPDWNEALKVWGQLEAQAESPIERQTMELHEANILIKQGKIDQARVRLDEVTDPHLLVQKQKLVAQIAPAAKK